MKTFKKTIADINQLSGSPSVSRNIALLKLIFASPFNVKSILEKMLIRWDQQILNKDQQLEKYFISIITTLYFSRAEAANTDINHNINLLQIINNPLYFDIQEKLKKTDTRWGKLMLAEGNQFKNYLINTAIIVGNLNFIKSIKEIEGTNLTQNEQEKRSLLQQGVKLGATKFVEALVDQEKMSVDTTDDAGIPLLFIAARNRDHAMLALLIKKGAPLQYRDRRGYNALAIVIESQIINFTPPRGSWYDAAICLLDANINTDAVDIRFSINAMHIKWYRQFPADPSLIEKHTAKRARWHNRFSREASDINFNVQEIVRKRQQITTNTDQSAEQTPQYSFFSATAYAGPTRSINRTHRSNS